MISLIHTRVIARAAALAVLISASLFAPDARGAELTRTPRTILVLFDEASEPAADKTRTHKYAEVVLNHLGYVLDYRSIQGPLPAEVGEFAAVLTWFRSIPNARRHYLDWAASTLPKARRLIVLGSAGGEFWTDDFAAVAKILARLGLKHERKAREETAGSLLVAAERRFVGFEREPDPVPPPYDIVSADRADVHVWLAVEFASRYGVERSVAVATSARGGYAQAGFELYEDPSLGRVAWLVDPFAFFAQALGGARWPIPDLTTVSGRRIFFSHVDSDGLNNVVVEPGKSATLVARIFLSEIVEKFPDLPVTFALTPGDLDPDIGGNKTPEQVVREIWARPNVEASVSSYTRPYHWAFFENYDRDKELERVEELNKSRSPGLLSLPAYLRPGGLEAYVASGPEFPRNYLRRSFDLGEETVVALQKAEALLPPGQRIRLYQWSGDAEPFERAIAATRQLGLLNINGGESRFDATYPSVAHVAPIARPIGRERQIYAIAASEHASSKSWRPVVSALKAAQMTAANTETPRRLAPYNIHYRLSTIGDSPARKFIDTLLTQARDERLIPVSTSDFVQMANDFFGVVIEPLDANRWAVTNRKALQTVRFDDADGFSLDLARSEGVLGATRHGRSLYVALDGAYQRAIVAIRQTTAQQPSGILLRDARWTVRDLSRSSDGMRFETHGFGPGDFVWEGLAPGTVEVTAARGEEVFWHERVEVGSEGRLQFSIPADGPLSADVTVLVQSVEARSVP
jgi:hypothetical protein